jgi:hypothetical protein
MEVRWRMVRAFLAGGLASLLIVPGGSADVRISDVRGPSDPLTIGGVPQPIEVDVEVDCTSLWLRSSPATGPMSLTIDADAHPDVSLTGDTQANMDSTACTAPQGVAAHTFGFMVGINEGPRAFEPLSVYWNASIPEHPADEAAPASTSFQVSADAIVFLQMQLLTNIVTVRGPTNLTMDLLNLGNVPIRVEFAASAETGSVAAPPAVSLGYRDTSAERAQVDFVYTPAKGDWNNAVVTLSATAFAEGPTDRSIPAQTASVLVKQPKDSVGAPTVPSPLFALALVTAAFLANRRRP